MPATLCIHQVPSFEPASAEHPEFDIVTSKFGLGHKDLSAREKGCEAPVHDIH
jgi:hypothetical protein